MFKGYFRDRIKSFGYAISGLKEALIAEHNLKIHLFSALLVIAAGFYFQVTSAEWIILLMMIGLVISAELFNTAIESLADYSSKGEHFDLIRKTKDFSAGAVLILAFVAVIVAIIIFKPYAL